MQAEDSRVRTAYTAAVTARGKKAHQDLAQVPRNLEEAHRDKGVSRATMMNIIRSSPTLQRCDERGIASLCKWVKFVAFPRHYRIMEQGASGDTMLGLVEGECDVYVNGGHIIRMGSAPVQKARRQPLDLEFGSSTGPPPLPLIANGNVLGEMAIVTGDPRSATVVAATKVVKMIEISRALLRDVLPADVWKELEDVALAKKQANLKHAEALKNRGPPKRINPLLVRRVTHHAT